MSEEYPLLYEELSEEDKFVPRFHRRAHMSIRGRARNQAKGAAAIIKKWPEYWTTLLAYWWIGLAMIALTTFIVYNIVFSFALFHPTNTKPIKSLNEIVKHYKSSVKPYNVYMHVFVNGTEAVDLNKYFPYVDIVANENKDFKFNFVVVLNDTNELPNLSEEMNNEVAMKAILTENKEYRSKNNIFLEHVSLSRYLDKSPIQKYWRSLPKQFLTFLVRAVSVWEKGGIAVNPVVFTPQSPSPIYIEKINKIFHGFKMSVNKEEDKVKDSPKLITKKVRKVTPKPNNIQDILNEFENHDIVSYDPPSLEVAESRRVINISKDNNSVSELHYLKDASTKGHLYHLNDKINAKDEQKSHSHQEKENASSAPKILPLFLNYLFHNDPPKNVSTETEIATTPRILRSTTFKEINKVEKVNEIKSNENMFKPMIVKANAIVNDYNTSLVTKKSTEENFELTVDLKGNLIATKIPCHAFVGGMFTNAVHHDETETLTDFIIKELSIFCKGLLTSCSIDVVLI